MLKVRCPNDDQAPLTRKKLLITLKNDLVMHLVKEFNIKRGDPDEFQSEGTRYRTR